MKSKLLLSVAFITTRPLIKSLCRVENEEGFNKNKLRIAAIDPIQEVMLLKRKMFEKHWQEFIVAPAFDLAETPLEIIGKA